MMKAKQNYLNPKIKPRLLKIAKTALFLIKKQEYLIFP